MKNEETSTLHMEDVLVTFASLNREAFRSFEGGNRKHKKMAEGTIKRLTDKGFGFIDTGGGQDMFFHMSSVEGTSYDQLREGQKVSFTEGEGPKGPRAENVRPV